MLNSRKCEKIAGTEVPRWMDNFFSIRLLHIISQKLGRKEIWLQINFCINVVCLWNCLAKWFGKSEGQINAIFFAKLFHIGFISYFILFRELLGGRKQIFYGRARLNRKIWLNLRNFEIFTTYINPFGECNPILPSFWSKTTFSPSNLKMP